MKKLSEFPRTRFAHLPTPLEPMKRLGAEIGAAGIWIKRDDCTGLAIGGNKTRKLEFLIGEAGAQHADTIITFGALQSNHVRQTAAAAARAGMRCELVLVDRVEYREPAYETSGNRLLDDLLGAGVHIVQNNVEAAQALQRIIDEQTAAGRRSYVVPVGGSNAIGSLGYVECARELVEQGREMGVDFGTLVTAVSSAGTQAGLIAGFAALGEPVRVVGINVYDEDSSALMNTLEALVDEVATTIEISPIDRSKLGVRHEFLGDGYGIPTATMREAVELTARCEGILLDPVYTGKAMAGMISMARNEGLGAASGHADGATVFLHTGGTPGLFAYRDALTAK